MNRFELIQSGQWPKYDLKVTLKPCFRCNHNCWFCSEYDNRTHMWSKDECDVVLDKLQELPVNKKKIFFYLYGGEPTLSKHWEYLHYRLVEMFKDRELFIQTQTNMSLTEQRLDRFLEKINNVKESSHTIDICSSYHLDKQKVDDFIKKMDICNNYNSLGLCFFSTEIPKEDQFLSEFSMIAAKYPSKIKLKFTVLDRQEYITNPDLKHLYEDDYLLGEDGGRYIEYRYFMRKYPELVNYLESGWNFRVDNKIKNYVDIKNEQIHTKFKYMKCQCGTKGIVIDHNLKVYHCNDDYYNRINISDLHDINFEKYLRKDVRCLNRECWDGLDFTKYR
jgi:organic radical activating enzyme